MARYPKTYRRGDRVYMQAPEGALYGTVETASVTRAYVAWDRASMGKTWVANHALYEERNEKEE